MRVIVFGGTRFIGLSLVEQLVEGGHSVAVVHRGLHEPEALRGVEHIHAERSRLGQSRAELLAFRPDAAVDMAAMTAEAAQAVTDALDPAVPLVAISSIDVYRACSAVAEGTVSDPVPLTEEAPLRQAPPPDRDVVPPGWDYDGASYEKLDVERIYLDRGATICRLPMVYGEGDYKRREEFILRRVRAGRKRIPVGPGSFLCSRAYAPEVARGIRLALESGVRGEVFHLAEPTCAPAWLWVDRILRCADHRAELVRVPEEHLPEDMSWTAEIPQPWLVDSTKARERLGWVHAPWEGCVERSVRWHLAHPPPEAEADFSADDAALAAVDPA